MGEQPKRGLGKHERHGSFSRAVMVGERVNLVPLVKRLPDLASELRQLALLPSRDEQGEHDGSHEAATKGWVTLSCGEGEIAIAPGTDVNKFIRQITTRFENVQYVLEQAEQVGSGISRRPYSEYIDGIERTGLALVEYYGFAIFVNGRLVYYPDYRVLSVKPHGDTHFEVFSLEEGTNSRSN
jgi:hypothetical protein